MYNICFLCSNGTKISINNLRKHFVSDHNLDFQKGNCFDNFQCRVNDCDAIFSSFKSYRIHSINHFKNQNALLFIAESESESNESDIEQTQCASNNAEALHNNLCSFTSFDDSLLNIISDLRNSTSESEVDFKKFIILCLSRSNAMSIVTNY